MQHPVGAEFNYDTMRMELTSISEIIFNPVAQSKFVHTVAAGYCTAAMFVLGVSSWYLLKGRDVAFAIRSFAVAAGFGLASVCSVIVLGDESGYTVGEVQRVKLAVIEAEWHTQRPPAAITVFGIPNEEAQRTDYEIKFPWMLGLMATRSVDTPITGIHDLGRRPRRGSRTASSPMPCCRSCARATGARTRAEPSICARRTSATGCFSRSTRPTSPTPRRSRSAWQRPIRSPA